MAKSPQVDDTKSGILYPVLPLRDIVVFPNMIVPLFVGREKSVRALERVAVENDQYIFLVTQKDATLDNPKAADLYTTGTVAQILQLLKLPDGTVKVLVEGVHRAKVESFTEDNGYLEAQTEIVAEKLVENTDFDALLRTSLSLFEQYIKLNPKIPPDVLSSLSKIEHPGRLADTIASHLVLKKILDKQALLETFSVEKRLEKLCDFMGSEISVLQVEKKIRGRVKRQMEKSQRDYYLNEQLKAIQKELSEIDDSKDEAAEIEKKIKATSLSKEAREKAESELKKLKTMSPMASEATVVRNYLDWLLGIPWKKPAKIKKDIAEASKILDHDHFGLT